MSGIEEFVRKKILIIDDDELLNAILHLRLEAEGFTTFMSKTGEEGIDLFKKVNPDLVLLDLRLPTMSSKEVFTIIKTHRPNTKIITTSAFVTSKTEKEEKSRGTDGFYDKAIRSEQLITTINAALKER